MRIGAVAVGCCVALVTASSAQAAPTCTFDPGSDLLQVDMVTSGDQVQLNVSGTELRVFDEGADPVTQVTCSGGTPTVTTTDSVFVIDGSDLPGGAALDGNTHITIAAPTDFAPGEDPETGHPANIEFVLNPNNGTEDELFVFGTEGSDAWEIGNGGFNWNAAADAADPDDEMALSNPTLFDEFDVYASGGEDTISARGGAATGAPLEIPGEASLGGGPGADVISGSDGDDFIGGDEGFDTMQGFAGNDTFRGFTGTDLYGGGPGTDTAAFTSSPAGVTVDLGQAAAQDTGEGVDTLSSIENLRGSDRSDTLIGSNGPNRIEGYDSGDTIDGRGGADALLGSEPGLETGLDTVAYGEAPAGVSVDLGAGTATGGDGADTLAGFENITGSAFADTLVGSAAANAITGLGGTDTVSALAGADAVSIRDGEADTASCGTEIDTATADEATTDSVNADCETVSFLGGPDDGGGGGGGAGGGGDGGGGGVGGGGSGEPSVPDTEVTFELSGKAKQRVVRRGGVVVRASCPLEDCIVALAGKLKPLTEVLEGGVAERLELDLKRKRLRKLAAALEDGRKRKVTVRATVTDAAGNEARDRLAVRAKP